MFSDSSEVFACGVSRPSGWGFTFSAVAHAALGGLQVVEQEVPAVAHGDGDAEKAAVLGAAVEELPGGAGRQLPHLAGPRQRGVLERQPHRRLGAAAVHLQGNRRQRWSLPPAHLAPGRLLHKHAAKPQSAQPCLPLHRQEKSDL